MSVPVPPELSAFVTDVSLDVRSNEVVITVSVKLLASYLISRAITEGKIKTGTEWKVLRASKSEGKIYVYVDPGAVLQDPFESVETRLAISQAKLESMIFSQVPMAKVYYNTTPDDVLMLVRVPVQEVVKGGDTAGTEPKDNW